MVIYLRIYLVSVLVMAATAGCVLRKSQRPALPPPASKPSAASEQSPAPAPEEPLSIPQTQVKLPPPQPISAEALASIPQHPVQAESPPVRHPRRTAQQAAAKPEMPPETPPPAPPVEEPSRARILPIVPEQERLKLKEGVENRWREVAEVLQRLQSSKLSPRQKSTIQRVQSFLELSDQAYKRGDMRQADALSERALLLARDLERAQ